MPGEPGSFGGARRPFIGTLFDRRKAQRYLRTQDAYTLHRQAKRRFPRRKTHSKGIADLYQADLVDLSSLSYNSYHYLLTCIDVFTKQAWAIPLRRKTGGEVTAAFRKILATSDRNPRMLQTDKGTEFLNAAFQRMLAVNDTHWYSTENEDIKVSVVECFNRTLKTKMSHYFIYKNLPRYIDVLPRQRVVPPFDRHVSERGECKQRRSRTKTPLPAEEQSATNAMALQSGRSRPHDFVASHL